MAVASAAWAASERRTITEYSLAKRFASSALMIDCNASVPCGEPKSGLARPFPLQGAGRAHAQLERRLPGEKECGAAGADAGKRRIAVLALEQVSHAAAPSTVGAFGSDRLPGIGLIEMGESDLGRVAVPEFHCALMMGSIKVLVFATMAQRPELKRFCTPVR
jgi:hypothetical protein